MMRLDEKAYYESLINKLISLPQETEWLEYKQNNSKPEMIGEYISALSNSAALYNKENAYMLWGIDDNSHSIVGTNFSSSNKKVGNEELLNWLMTQLSPRIDIRFVEIPMSKGQVVLLEIPRAVSRPTSFKNVEYIRNGSYKKLLREFPEKERKLWLSFETKPFEARIAKENIDSASITELLDCAAYYTLMKLPLPSNREGIMHDFVDQNFIVEQDNGQFSITNMGGLLFAKNISDFEMLKRKAIRIIKYKGNSKTNVIRERNYTSGYAIAFANVVDYIMSQIPQEEEIVGALRKEFVMFPEKAIREAIANMMIHQDFSIRGTGPMIEIFDTKIEISNPGSMLIDINRIIDSAPHSRNESIAAFMRIIHVCEERGSGFDRMEEGMSELKIPAPKVEGNDDFCRVKLYWHEKLADWSKEELIQTCYLHTCYCYVNEIKATNSVLSKRFGIAEKNKSITSRVIKLALEANMIKLYDESAGPRARYYVPFWA